MAVLVFPAIALSTAPYLVAGHGSPSQSTTQPSDPAERPLDYGEAPSVPIMYVVPAWRKPTMEGSVIQSGSVLVFGRIGRLRQSSG